jgi:uncharacterized protein YbaP (TraB family)
MSINTEKNYAQGFHYIVKKKREGEEEGEVVADIIGTSHTGPKKLYKLNPTIESAAIKAKKIAFEIVMTEERKKELFDILPTLQQATRNSYTNFYNENYIEEKTYKYQSSDIKNKKVANYNKNGTETLILKARGQNIDAVIPLETMKESAENLHYLAMSEMFLEEKREDEKISKKEIKACDIDSDNCHRNGDEALGKQAAKWRKRHDPARHHYLVKQRNYTLAKCSAPLIREANPENRVLIAIGCGHLFGKHGVQALLKKELGEDYSIEKFNSEPKI